MRGCSGVSPWAALSRCQGGTFCRWQCPSRWGGPGGVALPGAMSVTSVREASSGRPNSGHAGWLSVTSPAFPAADRGADSSPRLALCPTAGLWLPHGPWGSLQPDGGPRATAVGADGCPWQASRRAMAEQGEYHRLEDFEEDSPPGEEELLVHVTEGLQGSGGLGPSPQPSGWSQRGECGSQAGVPPGCRGAGAAPAVFLSLPDSWHHIKNLDNFFTKISLQGPCLAAAQPFPCRHRGGEAGRPRCWGRGAGWGSSNTGTCSLMQPQHLPLPPEEWLRLHDALRCL